MHQQAILSTPIDADFMAHRGLVDWAIFCRMNDGTLDLIGNCTDVAFDIFAAGVSARKLSIWNATAGRFESGSLEQLTREVVK